MGKFPPINDTAPKGGCGKGLMELTGLLVMIAFGAVGLLAGLSGAVSTVVNVRG